MMWLLDLLLYSPRSLRLWSFMFNLTSLFRLISVVAILSYGPSILTVSPSTVLSVLVTVFFSCKMFVWFFIPPISLLRLSNFSFVSRVFLVAHVSIFLRALLRYLSDNANICVISVLVSFHCLVSFSMRSFWFSVWWWVIFLLQTGHFCAMFWDSRSCLNLLL